jgi:hypothetical protein
VKKFVYLPNVLILLKAVFKGGDVLPVSITTATSLDQLLKDDCEEIWKQVESDFSARF